VTPTSPSTRLRRLARTDLSCSNPRCIPWSKTASSSRWTCMKRLPQGSTSWPTSRSSISAVEKRPASRHCCAGATPIAESCRPDEFIPFLEDSGMIVDVGRWVLQEACRQGARWQAGGTESTFQ
jgi:hypothetical protein